MCVCRWYLSPKLKAFWEWKGVQLIDQRCNWGCDQPGHMVIYMWVLRIWSVSQTFTLSAAVFVQKTLRSPVACMDHIHCSVKPFKIQRHPVWLSIKSLLTAPLTFLYFWLPSIKLSFSLKVQPSLTYRVSSSHHYLSLVSHGITIVLPAKNKCSLIFMNTYIFVWEYNPQWQW